MGVFNNFPYANFHELNADWIIEQVREVKNEWEEYKTDMDLWKLGVDDQLAEFQAWFDNLDVQDEVRTVINELIQSGEFIEITGPQIVSATEAWLAAHITPTTPVVDDTLSISGAAADAKVTGDRISDLKEDIKYIENDIGYEIIDLKMNKSINTADGETILPENIVSELNWCCCCVPCSANDVFTLQGSGGSSSRLWAFADSSGNMITQSNAQQYALEPIKVTAPQNSAYFAFNSRMNYSPFVYKGEKYSEQKANILNQIDNCIDLDELKQIVGFDKINIFNDIETINGYYVNALNGALNALAGYSATNYFEVISGANYELPYHSSGSQIAFYDKDKQYVAGFVTSKTTFAVPDNDSIKYARWCGETNSIAQWVLYLIPLTAEKKKYIDATEGLLAGIIDAYSKGIKSVIVKSGAYDIIAEYEAYYGADYFNNYADNYNNQVNGKFDCGIWLDNINVYFESGSSVTANYDGNNQYVKSYFSAFAVGQNVVIDGLLLDASELRYGIHPDFHASNTEFLIIKNCDLHHYKPSDSGVNDNQAIGAGLGVYSDWLVENCIFRSDTNNPVFRIHNNPSSNAHSRIVIKDCYIVGDGYILLNSYSTSTNQTNALVNGCSWKTPAVVGKETGDSNDNITMYAWNNETRS